MAIGRRTDLTPELQDKICALIRDQGMYPSRAAIASGITEATFYEWLARGRVRANTPVGKEVDITYIEPGTRGRGDDVGLYAEFAEAINKADADLEVVAVSDAVTKFKKSNNPLAPIIFLSRRFRDRWSEQIQVAAAGKEAVASMEKIKAAWDEPGEITEGEYRELPEHPKLEAGDPEATGSQKCSYANQSEATGFHLPPVDYIEPDTDNTTDMDITETDDQQATPNNNNDIEGLPPLSTTPTTIPTPAEISNIKSEEGR